MHIRTPLILLTFGLLAACGSDDRTSGALGAPTPLDSAEVAALSEQYPRLGAEPLPEPAPSQDADPAANAPDRVLETATGGATYYAQKFEGRRTASGIPFRQNQMVAAHRAYPFGTVVRVTNLRNDRRVNVRVVDRGPFGTSENARRTVIDVSRRAANELDFVRQGRAQVTVEVLEWGRGIRS